MNGTTTARAAGDEFARPVLYDRTTGPKAAALMVGSRGRPPDPTALPKLPPRPPEEE